MRRGRGKGRKLTAVTSHVDLVSAGEEVLPSHRRRGRPQKPFKDDADEQRVVKNEEEEDDMTAAAPETEVNDPTAVESGKKRKKHPRMKEDASSVLEENGVKGGSNFDDSPVSNGFRQTGSRRKSTPRRAAEVGVECK